MKTKEQCQEELKIMLNVLGELEPQSISYQITNGWIFALEWVLEHEN